MTTFARLAFVSAALLFWFGSGDAWQPLAIATAVVSTLGIVLFFGTWPMFNTAVALGVNAVVPVARINSVRALSTAVLTGGAPITVCRKVASRSR